MTYNPAIPQPSDSISGSQPPILGNFGQLNTLFGIDHIEYNNATAAARGRHKKITFNDVAADPGLATPITSLYTKKPGATVELFFQNDTLAANIVKLTGSLLVDSGNDGHGGGYYVFQTPWALKIWAGSLAPFTGSVNYTMSGTLSFGGGIYTAQLTPFGASPHSVSFTPGAGTKNFNAQMSAGAAPAYWMVISS